MNWTSEELLLAAYWYHKADYRLLDDTSPEAQELSNILRGTICFHPQQDRDSNFRSANSVAQKIRNIADTNSGSGPKSNGSKGDGPALRAFLDNADLAVQEAEAILEAIRLQARKSVALPSLEEVAYEEGGTLLVAHYKRERSPKLRAKKIEDVRRKGLKICCDVCDFDFGRVYGERGEGYIEVHHVTPLHIAGLSTTRLQDLALLCANCHRMIHNKKEWLTPLELKSIVRKNHD